jgi:hypothetical protein
MEEHRCEECGKNFGSRETLHEHQELEHEDALEEKNEEDPEIFEHLMFNREQLIGAFLGFVLAGFFITGINYVQAAEIDFNERMDSDFKEPISKTYKDMTTPEVEITVVTCDNCSYSRFKEETDEIMKADYREVDYGSEEGQMLIKKYDLYYVPGFIFDKKVEKTENFTRIESTLVEFDDAYVLPDRGIETAQRVSEGKSLDR